MAAWELLDSLWAIVSYTSHSRSGDRRRGFGREKRSFVSHCGTIFGGSYKFKCFYLFDIHKLKLSGTYTNDGGGGYPLSGRWPGCEELPLFHHCVLDEGGLGSPHGYCFRLPGNSLQNGPSGAGGSVVPGRNHRDLEEKG